MLRSTASLFPILCSGVFKLMKLLVVGGSGYVASLVRARLAARHSLRIFDLKPPIIDSNSSDQIYFEYVEGSVSNHEALESAAKGVDALLYMAMGPTDWSLASFDGASFDANVKGVYLALKAAHLAGVSHAVYTSSMSVYDGDLYRRYFPDEEITPDSRHIYGFTKLLGEECCRVAAREWGISVNALRLCLPVTEEKWLRETRPGAPTIMTTADDVAEALLAALDYQGHGFQPFMISGDYEEKLMNMSRARKALGWAPKARPVVDSSN